MKIAVLVLVDVSAGAERHAEAARVAAVAALRDKLDDGKLDHGELGRQSLATHGLPSIAPAMRAVEVSAGGVCWEIPAPVDWANDPRTEAGRRVCIRTRQGQTFEGTISRRESLRGELSISTGAILHYVAFSDIRQVELTS